MTTQSIHFHFSDPDLDRGARRIRGRRRSAAAGPSEQAGRDTATRGATESSDHPAATPQARGVGQARVLRRWRVTDLIARAGGAPRVFA
jgi:hypothetical protein